MQSLDEIAVKARREMVPFSETADMLVAKEPNASIDDVVHAFAIAGYPAVDNYQGTLDYLFRRTVSNEMDEQILNKMREVGYPENEVIDAKNSVKG